jgi:hypothetical protein
MSESASARRLTRSFVQTIEADPIEVFPLLCPEREKEWLPGWDARMIHSTSGVAEHGAVFESRHEAGKTIWIVTDYDSPRKIAFARWQPDGLVVHIEICLGRHHGGGTAVCISYTHTAINASGEIALAKLDNDSWLRSMASWQESMNKWLRQHRDAPHR